MRTTALVAALAFVLLFSSAAAAASQAELLQVGLHSDEGTLNPYTYVTGTPGLDLVNLSYDTLFQLDENNLPQPWLVREYEVGEERLTYSLTLHEGVTWHDGEPFTAEDVKFTYQYVLDHPKSRFTRPAKQIESIEVLDEHHLVMTLRQPSPNFLIQPLADLPILPQHVWESVEEPSGADLRVGTGPFILEELKAGQYYKFQANPDYFQGAPAAKTLVLPIIKDTTALFTALKSGELDAVTKPLTPELVDEFENTDLTLKRGPGYSTTLLQLNNERHPLNLTEFRKALALTVDLQELVDTVLLGQATPASPGFIHPKSPYYNEEISPEGPDSERAAALLDDLGFVNTDDDAYRETPEGEDFELTLLVYANNPTRLRAAELLVEDFQALKLDVSVKALDPQTVDSLVWPEFDVSKGRDYDLSMWGWSPSVQLFPSRLVELFHSDFSQGILNIGAFQSEEFDSVADELRATYDDESRRMLIDKLQAIVAEEHPIIPLYHEDVVNAYNAEAYDGWRFTKGKGIINKLSFIIPATEAGETTSGDKTQTKDDSGGGSPGQNPIVWVAILLVVAGGGYLFSRRGA